MNYPLRSRRGDSRSVFKRHQTGNYPCKVQCVCKLNAAFQMAVSPKLNAILPRFLHIFFGGKIMKNCTSCKIEHRQILWLLFVRGFKTSLIVGRLGVEDQQNDLREVPILRHVIYYLWCLAKQELCRSKSRTCDELDQQMWNTFVAVPLNSQRRVLSLYHSACRSMCKTLGPALKSETEW